MKIVNDMSGERSMRIELMPPNILACDNVVTSLRHYYVQFSEHSTCYTFGQRDHGVFIGKEFLGEPPIGLLDLLQNGIPVSAEDCAVVIEAYQTG
jgi:hypothetical protein